MSIRTLSKADDNTGCVIVYRHLTSFVGSASFTLLSVLQALGLDNEGLTSETEEAYFVFLIGFAVSLSPAAGSDSFTFPTMSRRR